MQHFSNLFDLKILSSPRKDNIRELTNPFAPHMLFSGAFGGITILRNKSILLLLLAWCSFASAWMPSVSCLIWIQKEDFFFCHLGWPMSPFCSEKTASEQAWICIQGGKCVNPLLCLSFYFKTVLFLATCACFPLRLLPQVGVGGRPHSWMML